MGSGRATTSRTAAKGNAEAIPVSCSVVQICNGSPYG
jgi:hypothetical protein